MAGLIGLSSMSAALPPGFLDEALDISWQQATGLTFDSTGRAYVWEKAGRVWTVENGVKSAQPLVDIHEEVRDFRDHGLLGFTLDPNFQTNHYIYLLYVADVYHILNYGEPDYDANASLDTFDTIARITRYTLDPATNFNSVIPSSRHILVGETITTGIPMVNESHGVGTLVFGEDGSLLATAGDSASFALADHGGDVPGTYYTFVTDGICKPKEDVGAYRAQLVDGLNGKILRLDPATGDGLPDNPFYDEARPRDPRSRVWAMGLRNPFRVTIVPETGYSHPGASFPGVLVIGDVGWEEWEEINVCTAPGQNFGWPIYEGFDLQPMYNDGNSFASNLDAPNPLASPPTCGPYFNFQALLAPDSLNPAAWPNPCNTLQTVPSSIARHVHKRAAIAWDHADGAFVPTYGPSGLPTASRLGTPGCPATGNSFGGFAACAGVWYHGENFPEDYHDTFFFMDYAAGWIRNIVFDPTYNVTAVREFDGAQGPVCMAIHPLDGTIYYISYNEDGTASMHRISYGGDGMPIVHASASPNFGPLPLAVQFSTTGTIDPEGQALTFLWDFGDGSPTSNNPHPSHTYAGSPGSPTTFTATVTVTDTASNAVQKTVRVFGNNTPPSVSITSPVDGSHYPLSGSLVEIPLSATVSDAESPGQTMCTWQVILHHNTHTHPETPIVGCTQVASITSLGCEADSFSYEFRLVVADAQGLTTTVSSFMSAACCPADVDDGSGTGTIDGAITIDDLLYYLGLFQLGDIAADLDDGTATNTHDGAVTIDDLLYYLQRFQDGC
ncbi:MAG: PQQ-dependent sugar dehydrogenase [Phycisphaerales bacterium]|nr:MAG: PQQ-dependent sugar dehydrogenase [Phycisphaerales bacterium]